MVQESLLLLPEKMLINLVGVWTSTVGDVGTWTRIAGGKTLGVDSVAGWQPYGVWGRVVLALNKTQYKIICTYIKMANHASGQIRNLKQICSWQIFLLAILQLIHGRI